MIGSTISHFVILEKLGEGGMGVVYKARDVELDRIVALKFLPERLTANDAERARFLQEAKAASALNHPNVCTIYGIEEVNGQKFIEMEYVDGVTLRRKIQEGQLKVNDALAYAVQIGEALQEAHSKGIVHRDVKCENIMLTAKNQIKVMDFGLAKLKGSLKLTRTSSTVGTLAYMAPEQIQGGEVDARSDIFSFGVVLFELLTGAMPFRGEHEAAMMYSILNEDPDSVRRHREGLSPELDRIIGRALEKDPADRYQHVDDMVSELRRLQKQSTRVVRPSATSLPSNAGVPAPKRKKGFFIVLAAAVVLIGAVVVYLLKRPEVTVTQTAPSRQMLVVLPFENLGSPEKEYFADGITEEITSKLSGLSGLGVIARSSAMQYKKTTKPLKQIGEELGVSFILQGTIRWEDAGGTSHVRVNPQLIRVADGTQIWSQPAEAVVSSVFKLQAEIASQVAAALDITLLQGERKNLEARPTENSEAYDLYLRGNEFLYRSTEQRDYLIAEQMFQRAVTLDPKFAAAYARLAALHSHIYWEYFDHTPERARKSKEAAQQALDLDPQLPDAHGAMGWYYYHCLREYDSALGEFKRALAMQPGNDDLLLGLASINRRLGKLDDALGYFQRIVDIDPRSASKIAELAETYMLLRRYDQAEKLYDRALSLAPDVAQYYCFKAWLHLAQGNVQKARDVLEVGREQKIGEKDPVFLFFSVHVDVLSGHYREAATNLESREPMVFDYQQWYIPKDLVLAEVYGLLREPSKERGAYDRVRTILEREVKKHPDDARIHSSLGIAYAGLGQREAAVREGKAGVEILPVSVDALTGPYRLHDLARIYVMIGDEGSALTILEKFLSVPSEYSPAMIGLEPAWNSLRTDPRFQNLISRN